MKLTYVKCNPMSAPGGRGAHTSHVRLYALYARGSGVTTAGVAKPRDAPHAAQCTGRGTRSGRQAPPALMAARPRSR